MLMDIVVDARGLACPEPVVLTSRALEKADEITAIVDNQVAKENVSRLARSKGFRVEIEEKGDLFYLHLTRESIKAERSPASADTGPTILLIPSDSFGRGSEELGQLLMRSFLHTLSEVSPSPIRSSS